jgi:hypothetical protein
LVRNKNEDCFHYIISIVKSHLIFLDENVVEPQPEEDPVLLEKEEGIEYDPSLHGEELSDEGTEYDPAPPYEELIEGPPPYSQIFSPD